MPLNKFKVCVSGEVLARGMDMDSMLLFVKAFFEHYQGEDKLVILREESEDSRAEQDDDW